MDAKYYNGEPGALSYDRDYDERGPWETTRRTVRCVDCGASGLEGGDDGWHLYGEPMRVLCPSCLQAAIRRDNREQGAA